MGLDRLVLGRVSTGKWNSVSQAGVLLCSPSWEATNPRAPPGTSVTESGLQMLDPDLI